MGTGWEKKKVAFRHLHIDLGDLWFLLFRFLLFFALLSLFATPLLAEVPLLACISRFFFSLPFTFFFDEFLLLLG